MNIFKKAYKTIEASGKDALRKGDAFTFDNLFLWGDLHFLVSKRV